MELYYLTTLATSFLCFLVIGICICRLNLCGKKIRSRIKYTALIFAASVAGMQPYYTDKFPGVGALIMVACVVWLLVDGAPAWRSYRHIEGAYLDTQIYDPDLHGGEDE